MFAVGHVALRTCDTDKLGPTARTTAAAPLTEKQKLARLASNTWPIRYIFKSRTAFGRNPRNDELKKKYGELTMLDFPQFTKDTFPGVTHMDLFSGLFEGEVYRPFLRDVHHLEVTGHAGPRHLFAGWVMSSSSDTFAN